MTGPMGNNEFCFPATSVFPSGFALGNIEGLGAQSLRA